MGKSKVCIDIGGTKTIFAVIDDKLNIKTSVYLQTPKRLAEFKAFLNENLEKLSGYSDTANVSVAGRIDKNGKMLFCPNLPIKNFNLKNAIEKRFRDVHVDNDANCFAVYELFRGRLKDRHNGVLLVWGTGIGGSLVIDKTIYHGSGLASEMGHIKVMTEPKTDIEELVGGRWLSKRFQNSGLELNSLAKKGDKSAINEFRNIGKIFGRYLSSLCYLFDPEIFIIGGSFSKSWKFMKDSIKTTIKEETLRGKANIKVEVGDFYVIKGCYFLDEYEKLHNKL